MPKPQINNEFEIGRKETLTIYAETTANVEQIVTRRENFDSLEVSPEKKIGEEETDFIQNWYESKQDQANLAAGRESHYIHQSEENKVAFRITLVCVPMQFNGVLHPEWKQAITWDEYLLQKLNLAHTSASKIGWNIELTASSFDTLGTRSLSTENTRPSMSIAFCGKRKSQHKPC